MASYITPPSVNTRVQFVSASHLLGLTKVIMHLMEVDAFESLRDWIVSNVQLGMNQSRYNNS